MVKSVPQGSIVGPLLFNLFINDLFFILTMSAVRNFAEDNTLHNSNKELETVFKNLETNLDNVLSLFEINSLKANPRNLQFLVLGSNENGFCVLNIGLNKIQS